MNNKEISRHDIQETPFSAIVDNESGETRVALANQIILRDSFKTEAEAADYVKGKFGTPWELIMNTISICVEYTLKAMEESKKNNLTPENHD